MPTGIRQGSRVRSAWTLRSGRVTKSGSRPTTVGFGVVAPQRPATRATASVSGTEGVATWACSLVSPITQRPATGGGANRAGTPAVA